MTFLTQSSRLFLAGALLAILVVGCTPKNTAAPNSVAVVYFDHPGEASDAFFVDGFHGELILTLSKIQSIEVIGQHSVAALRDADMSLAEIASELGVANILEGSVERSDGTVNIHVQLTEADSGKQRFAQTFERDLSTESLIAIQAEIAEGITQALDAELTEDEQARIRLVPTENLDAYLAFLRGEHLLRNQTDDNIIQAIVEYKAAMELDQDFAAAWWGLGEAAYRDVMVGARSMSNGWGVAREAKEQGAWLDEYSGRGWGSRAIVRLFDVEPVEAQEAMERALELSPNDSLVHKYAKDYYVSTLQLDQAGVHMEKALALDPLWAELHADNAVYLSRSRRDFAAAQAAAKRAVELGPDDVRNARTYADLLKANKKGWGDALAWMDRAIELEPDKAEQYGNKATLLMDLGFAEGLEALLPELEEVGPRHYTIPMMDLWAALGENNFEDAEAAALLAFQRNPRAMVSVTVSMLAHNDHLPEAVEVIEDSGRRWLEKPEEWPVRLTSRLSYTCGTGWMLNEAEHEEFDGKELIRQTTAMIEERLVPHWKDPSHWAVIDCLAVNGKTEEALAALKTHLDRGYWDGWWWRRHQVFYQDMAKDPRFDDMWNTVEQEVAELRAQLVEEGVL